MIYMFFRERFGFGLQLQLRISDLSDPQDRQHHIIWSVVQDTYKCHFPHCCCVLSKTVEGGWKYLLPFLFKSMECPKGLVIVWNLSSVVLSEKKTRV